MVPGMYRPSWVARSYGPYGCSPALRRDGDRFDVKRTNNHNNTSTSNSAMYRRGKGVPTRFCADSSSKPGVVT